MNTRTGLSWLLPVLAFLLLSAAMANAQVYSSDDLPESDLEPTDNIWVNVVPAWSTSEVYFVDGNGLVQKWTYKHYYANDEHEATHVRTDENNMIDHYHAIRDIGDGGGAPTKAQANTYWDARLGAARLNIWRLTDATVTGNCHSWAFKWKADAGTVVPKYEYWIEDYSTAYTDDRTDPSRGIKSGAVIQYDFLRWGTGTGAHTAVVTAIAPSTPPGILNIPMSFECKFNSSGSYHYVTPIGNDWDFPYCKGGKGVIGNTVAQQNWTWDPAYMTNPLVFADD